MLAYWFSNKEGLTPNMRRHNASPAEAGRTDYVHGEIIPCRHGLHASPTPWDALQHARGDVLWEVEIADDALPHGDPVNKFASPTRKYLRKIDFTATLRMLAAQQALSVINLWAAPEIVAQYLQDESIGKDRSDIRAAARAAAGTVRAAAWDTGAAGAALDAAGGGCVGCCVGCYGGSAGCCAGCCAG